MTRNTLMRLMAAILLGIGGAGVRGFGGAASARPGTDSATFMLHGSGPFGKAEARATVIRLSDDRFRLSLNAKRLPSPTILHVKYARHAYVAWLVNGEVMHGPLHMAAMGLAPTREPGTYAGEGTVTISGVTSVIITAEPTAQAYMPIMPVLTVLASTGPRDLG